MSSSSVRVRVTNGVSGRSKDLVLSVDTATNLYETVYDNPSVKTANIRKWDSSIVQEVKTKQSEIRCLLWNESAKEALHNFSVNDLRNTSTHELVEMLYEFDSSTNLDEDHIKLVLECSKIKSEDNGPGKDKTNGKSTPVIAAHISNKKDKEDSKVENDDTPLPSSLPPLIDDGLSDTGSLGGGSHDGEVFDVATTMRLRIINQTSRRFKDLVVTISDDLFVFKSIYDNDAVKNANVRKWSSDIVNKVKTKRAQIQCLIMDEATGKPFHTLSISDMKTTSTKKLNEMAEGSNRNLIKLVLCCTEDDDSRSTIRNSSESQISQTPVSVVHAASRSSVTPSTVDSPSTNKQSTFDSTTIGSKSTKIKPLPGEVTGETMRVQVVNESSGRSKDLLVDIDEGVNLFDSIYDNKAVKEANVRKWGSEVVQDVKNKIAEIKFHVWDEDIEEPFHTFSIDELKTTSTKRLFNIAAEPRGVVKLVLRCEKTKPEPPESSAAAVDQYKDEVVSISSVPKTNFQDEIASMTTFQDEIASIKTKSMADLESIRSRGHQSSVFTDSLDSTMFQKKTVRVRITNHKTKRFKDLVVDIRHDLMVHDAIYDNKAVKDANVRKWGSEIAKEVKSGVSEIQLEIWDDVHPIPYHIFSIEDLKSTSTRALVEIVPREMDPVQLRLQCVKKNGTEKTSSAHDEAEMSQQSSSGSVGKLKPKGSTATMPKRHMSLAAINKVGNHSSSNLDKKRESLVSLNDQVNARANFQFGMSGLRNEAWSASNPDKKPQKQLFAKQLNSLPSTFPAAVGDTSGGTAKQDGKEDRSEKGKEDLATTTSFEITSKQDKKEDRSEKETGDLVTTKSFETSRTSPSTDSLAGTDGKGQQSTSSDVDDKVKRFLRLSTSNQDFQEEKLSNGSLASQKVSLSSDDKVQRFLRISKAREESSRSLLSDAQGEEDSSEALKPIHEQPKTKRPSFQTSEGSMASYSSPDGDPVKHFLRLCRAKKSRELIDKDTNDPERPNSPVLLDTEDTKINRFLQLSKASSVAHDSLSSVGSMSLQKSGSSASINGLLRRGISDTSLDFKSPKGLPREPKTSSDKDKLKRFLNLSNNDFLPPAQAPKGRKGKDAPPIAEISVITNGPISTHIESTPPNENVFFSGELLKEVFPYHVALDSDFRILQVGSNLGMLFDDSEDESVRNEPNFVGRIVSDIFMVTGPIPMFGQWDWSVLERMKEKTIFFESVLTESTTKKARLKGTVIEVSRHPRKVLLNLLPNVKNLTELQAIDLSMGDLPLHSCQREAVLLGEHSASEVKLTNHLDMLHRDLINSMEQQIKDRTNELAEANEGLANANTQIQLQSARQLEHFACMSHEIRTPLNCIVGMSSILLEETNSQMDPMLAESIQMIFTSGELLRAVVDDVLDYAKLESGSFEVDICKINLQDSLAGVVHSISQKIQDKNIRLRTHFSADLPKFTETDSRRLQQVLFNLLGNSGKFSKTNSVIDLHVSLIPKALKDRRERFICDPSNSDKLENHDIVRFSIKDYGKGIDKKDFTTIFQPFSQASKQTATVYGGTGLGLSITSKLVNRLGGEISLDSELGKFAQFTVDLPFKGETVNIESLKAKLEDIKIIIVDPKASFDYSFTAHEIDEEPEALGQEVVDKYGLHVERSENLQDLTKVLTEGNIGANGKHVAVLLREQLYDETGLAKIIDRVGPQNCTIMTFGPNYQIEATKQRHFKSLLGSFPSTLLESIANHVASTKQGLSSPTITLKEKSTTTEKNEPAESSDPKNATKRPKASNQNAKSAQPSKKNKAPPPNRNLKVLYAEDNKINQKVLSRVLNRVGITDITIVDDGLKAVNISEKESFDIVFMDMQMPVMDGMEACSLIVERDKDAKVVFVTAHALDEFKDKAEAAGGTSFISKPFRVQDIERVLAELGFP